MIFHLEMHVVLIRQKLVNPRPFHTNTLTTCMHSSHLHCALLSFLANAVSNSKYYSQHLSLHNFIVPNGYEVIVAAKDSGRIHESWQSQKMLLIMIVKILYWNREPLFPGLEKTCQTIELQNAIGMEDSMAQVATTSL